MMLKRKFRTICLYNYELYISIQNVFLVYS